MNIDVTLLAAIIAAIAAIVSPLLAAIINHKSAHKIKVAELYFTAKATAYSELLNILSKFPEYPTEEDCAALDAAYNKAALYSSPETGIKLADCVDLLVDGVSSETLDAYAKAKVAVISALQEELKQC